MSRPQSEMVNTLDEIRAEADSDTLDLLYTGTAYALIELVEAARELVGMNPDGSFYVAHDPHGDLIREHLIPALARFG